MVVIIQKFVTFFTHSTLKITFSTRLRPFYSTSGIIRQYHYSNVMEQFAVRNVEDDDRLQMSFNYFLDNKSRSFNMDRLKSEAVSLTLTRLIANVEKHFFKKKKTKKGKTADKDAESCSGQNQINKINALLSVNGLKVADDTPNEAAWIDGAQVMIGSSTFTVVVNLPTVTNISLPTCLMVNFPVFPTIITEFSSTHNLIWYKGEINLKSDFDSSKSVKSHHIREWTKVSENSQFTPEMEDIGSALKVECVPKNVEKGKEGFKKESVADFVIGAGPGFCPFENRHVFTQENTGDSSFRIVSYNILADLYADSDFSRENLFPLCPPYALKIDYRVQLLLKELKGYNSDLICLQEVDRKVFEHELLPVLSQLGYNGCLKEKEGEVHEGTAIFYRNNKFKLISNHDINISQSLQKDDHNNDLWTKVNQCQKLRDRILERNSCLQVALLECVTQPGRHVLVGTTHFYFHPNASHIRMLQGAVCIRHLQNLIHHHKIQGLDVAPIFCGDLNWPTKDGLLLYLLNNELSANDPAWMSSGDDEYFGGSNLTHDLSLTSACAFPDYTNYVVGFNGCLDYILVDRDIFSVDQIIPMPSHEEVTLHGALPNIVFPSDHIALLCDLRWNKCDE